MKYKIYLRDRNFIPYNKKQMVIYDEYNYDNLEWVPILKLDEKSNWIIDDVSDEDFVVYTDGELQPLNSGIHDRRKSHKNSIAWLIEPYEVFPLGYDYVSKNPNQFYKILTYDKTLLSYPNAIFHPLCTLFLEKKYLTITPKTKKLSIVCSQKNFTSGHSLRHQAKSLLDIEDVYGGKDPLECSIADSYKDYMFQIVVENCKKDYWFSEKLTQCFLTGVIPIYWGCPSIKDFFDINGIITFDTIDELKNIKENLSYDLYLSKMDSIKKNYELASKFTSNEQLIYDNIIINDDKFHKYKSE